MAQLSVNTVFYDQLIKRIQSFIKKYSSNNFSSHEEIANEFHSLITEINKYSTDPIAKYEQVIKGEPPSSEKFNRFISSVADDLNIIAKQLDYQSAQLVSLYNLFNSEIEKENQFTNRIKSKIRILQAYSEAPSEDLYYFGDSFENMDFIDIDKIPRNLIPFIKGGNATLPVVNTSSWNVRTISIVEESSNGFIGNNHAVYAKENVDTNYRYMFQDNNSVGLLQNVTDSNPLTYFEYEGINIDESEKIKNGAKDFEFTYIAQTLVDGRKVLSYKNWSQKELNKPLKLTLKLKADKTRKTNSVTIIPYFGRSRSSLFGTKSNINNSYIKYYKRNSWSNRQSSLYWF